MSVPSDGLSAQTAALSVQVGHGVEAIHRIENAVKELRAEVRSDLNELKEEVKAAERRTDDRFDKVGDRIRGIEEKVNKGEGVAILGKALLALAASAIGAIITLFSKQAS